jgi:hypothetical protein
VVLTLWLEGETLGKRPKRPKKEELKSEWSYLFYFDWAERDALSRFCGFAGGVQDFHRH